MTDSNLTQISAGPLTNPKHAYTEAVTIQEADPTPDLPRAGRYGNFEPSGAFAITDVRTPRPWINVLTNGNYGVVLSQVGGGFSWVENCQLYRVSRWEQDLVRDSEGRFIYVLDKDDPEQIWSTTYQPTANPAEHEEVVHDLGCTTFSRRFEGIETSHTVFVPLDRCAEVWIVEVRNSSDRVRDLRLGGYLEWHLGRHGEVHREFQRLFIETRSLGDSLLAWKHTGLVEGKREADERPRFAFVGCSGLQDIDWITDKREWLGPDGSPARPAAMFAVPRSRATSRWDDPIAGWISQVTLRPGESLVFTVTIGAEGDAETALASAAFFSEETARAELARVRAHWQDLCVVEGLDSGDFEVDVMTNRWLPYQAIAGRLLARCAYYQQGGAYGFRDQLQDSLIYLNRAPSATLDQLGKHAEAMYEDGGVRHWWHPGTDTYAESRHSDTCLWLSYGLLEYLDATGDLPALDYEFSFLNRRTQSPGSTGTLWEHCRRGIDRALTLRSSRGLPLIGAGDWNDGLSHAGIEGRGESTWVAMFLFHILQRFLPILDQLGKTESADHFRTEAEHLKKAVNDFAWDGNWYIAGTRDDGDPFGSSACESGEIFLNPQTWAVISGIAPKERAIEAMRSVKDRLLTPYGALLLRPAYSKVDPYIGYITRYAPGLRENGGVYSHASCWAVMAFALIGELDVAERLYRSMLPSSRAAENPDLYAAEPYVMPGNVDGPDSPYEGRAGWTWYTGSAAWMVRVRSMLDAAASVRPGQ